MMSAIIIFVIIMRDIFSEMVPENIALLDIAAGYFARLEVLTDFELSFSIVRQLAEVARKARTTQTEMRQITASSPVSTRHNDIGCIDQADLEFVSEP